MALSRFWNGDLYGLAGRSRADHRGPDRNGAVLPGRSGAGKYGETCAVEPPWQPGTIIHVKNLCHGRAFTPIRVCAQYAAHPPRWQWRHHDVASD